MGSKVIRSILYNMLFALMSLMMITCSEAGMDLEALKNNSDVLVQRAEDVEILYSDSAQLLVKIAGPVLLDYIDRFEPKTEFPEGVKVEFYDDFGEVKSILIANYGLRLTKENKTIARDSVVLTTAAGEKMETEELIWDENTARIYSNKFCVIHKEDEIIQGYGFEANEDFSESKIRKVTGRIKIKKPKS